jgi:hypothetical protein
VLRRLCDRGGRPQPCSLDRVSDHVVADLTLSTAAIDDGGHGAGKAPGSQLLPRARPIGLCLWGESCALSEMSFRHIERNFRDLAERSPGGRGDGERPRRMDGDRGRVS